MLWAQRWFASVIGKPDLFSGWSWELTAFSFVIVVDVKWHRRGSSRNSARWVFTCCFRQLSFKWKLLDRLRSICLLQNVLFVMRRTVVVPFFVYQWNEIVPATVNWKGAGQKVLSWWLLLCSFAKREAIYLSILYLDRGHVQLSLLSVSIFSLPKRGLSTWSDGAHETHIQR